MHTPSNLLDLYLTRWERFADRPALTWDDQTFTYKALQEEVQNIAGRLRQAGIEPQNLVALSMERSAELVMMILGVMATGACPCPLDTRLTSQEIQSMLSTAGITTVISDHISTTQTELRESARFLDAYSLPAANAYWATDIKPDAPGLLLFTSGSTGKPKGVLLSHRGLLNNAKGVVEHTQLRDTDKLLHSMPLYHTNGLNNQLFSPFLVGAEVILAPRFRASDMPALMKRYQPTIITGVPTMYSRMLDHPFTPESVSRLRFARCGSAPLTQDLHQKIEAHLGCDLIVSYGLSEATCTSTMNPPSERKVGSIGTALPFQIMSLRAPDGSVIRTPHTEGEICIEGDSMMLGYLGTHEDGILEPAPQVLHSGDLGEFDHDNYFYITGRLKDVIIRGGENISPAVIENTISTSPAVRQCCVVGRPHKDLGEVPVAFIVPSDHDAIDTAGIKDLVIEQLSRSYRLDDIYVVDSLPENSVGKIDRKALVQRLAEIA